MKNLLNILGCCHERLRIQVLRVASSLLFHNLNMRVNALYAIIGMQHWLNNLFHNFFMILIIINLFLVLLFYKNFYNHES